MRILLGMSGGLDSTYALKKLLDEGHSVEGAVLVMHPYTENDLARQSADSFGVKLHVINCEKEFSETVIPNFISQYKSGRTPNPCVICNSEIKFKLLYEYAIANGFDAIATGHYANIVKINDEFGTRYALSCPTDDKKDQTYVLWRLSQEILSKLVLPLYNNKKETVRAEAKSIGLVAADREDSQEICFIPDNDYVGYIERSTGPSPKGNFVDCDGNILGQHKGIINYTVGQRKGLGIAMGKRVFVTDIDPITNAVTLSPEDRMSDRVEISSMVFSGMREPPINSQTILFVKLRYLAKPTECILSYHGNGRATLSLSEPVRAVTPGQSAVFYRDGVLMAGGFIDKKN